MKERVTKARSLRKFWEVKVEKWREVVQGKLLKWIEKA